MKYNTVIYIDTETTGLDAKTCRIIELAAVKVVNGVEVDSMDEFICLPEGDTLPEKITEITGITDAMLAEKGISEEKAFARLKEMFEENEGKTLICAYNAQFDLNFLLIRTEETDYSVAEKIREADYLDSLTVYRDRRAFPHKLENAITAYELDGKVENSHRAVDDCKALWAVTEEMKKERDDLDLYINLFGTHPKYGMSGIPLDNVRYKTQPYIKAMTVIGQRLCDAS